jgi:type VI secretion system protein ImpH
VTRRHVFAEWGSIERATGRRIGAAHPEAEPIRFVPQADLAFAAVDARRSAHRADTWTTHFATLCGAESELPPYLAEDVALEDPDRAVRRALLTPFHHRATALLYRSVQRARLAETTRDLDDAWPRALTAMLGVDAPAERSVALAIAPLLRGPRSASSFSRALAVVSERWFGALPVALVARSGGRVRVDERDRSRLGRARLGDDAWLGSTVDDPSARGTVRFGPTDDASAHAWLSNAHALFALRAVIRWFSVRGATVDVEVLIETPPLVLGRSTLGRSAVGRSRSTRLRRIDPHATHARHDREPSARHAASASEESAHAP